MMATKFKTASIGNFVERVDVWDPRAATQGTEFDYVDIASIDREQKEITAPTRMLTSEAPSRARQLIKHRDVLVSTVRPNLNAVAWVPRDLDGATASTGFSVVRCKRFRAPRQVSVSLGPDSTVRWGHGPTIDGR